jgi:hypothetical protein
MADPTARLGAACRLEARPELAATPSRLGLLGGLCSRATGPASTRPSRSTSRHLGHSDRRSRHSSTYPSVPTDDFHPAASRASAKCG